jgi:hypothetical protein
MSTKHVRNAADLVRFGCSLKAEWITVWITVTVDYGDMDYGDWITVTGLR